MHVVTYEAGADLHALLAALDEGPVVVLPSGGARLVAPLSALAEAFVDSGLDAVFTAGTVFAAVGWPDALAAALAGEVVDAEHDALGEWFALVDDLERDLVPMGGRLVHAVTGIAPLAAVVDPAGPSEEVPEGVDQGDLAALCAGIGATPDPDDDAVTAVASEILTTALWSPSWCAALVQVAEDADQWSSDPDDPVPGDEVSLATLSPRLFGFVEADVEARLVPRLRRHWPHFAWCGLHDVFVIRYTAVGDGPSPELALHHDVAQISASVRLDDGFDGGELEFPRQGWDNGSVPVGTVAAWPSLVTHPHRGRPVRSGVKHGLTMWFRLPET